MSDLTFRATHLIWPPNIHIWPNYTKETFPGKCFGTEATKHLHRTNQDRNALVQRRKDSNMISSSDRLWLIMGDFFLQPFWGYIHHLEMYKVPIRDVHPPVWLTVCVWIYFQRPEAVSPAKAAWRATYLPYLPRESECQSSETWKLSWAVAYKRMERIAQTCL